MTDQLVARQVQYGCAVAAQSVPDGTVQIAAGGLTFDNAPLSFAAVASFDILTGHPADPSLDRYDVVGSNSSGAATLVVGTPGTPGPTDLTTLATIRPFAQIRVPAGATTITSDLITDARGVKTVSDSFGLIHASPYRVSGTWYGPPGVNASASSPTASGNMYLVPFFTAKALTLQAIGVQIASTGGAGSKARLGIYSDDGAGYLTLLVDAGQVPIDSGTSQSAAIGVTLVPGFSWFAVAFQSIAAPAASLFGCAPPFLSPIGASGLQVISGASFTTLKSYGAMFFTGVTGALPSNPTSPDYTRSIIPGVWVQAA